ncbi:preprotein translocase subunit SecE [Candidatus Latescibacterota bacterium]
MIRIIEKLKIFLKEVKSEMSKVTWPSWTDLKGSTILVIIVSVFFAVYVGFVDVILSYFRSLF